MALPLGHLYHLLIVHLFTLFLALAFAQNERQFIYNGFKGAKNLHLDGLATIQPNGLLQMTNRSIHKIAHAFYKHPIIFKQSLSFSTTFAFAIYPQIPSHSGHGIAFVISPTMNLQQAFPSEYLGLFNTSTNGLSSNHVLAVELDTVQNNQVGDMNGNHVGLDVNSVNSVYAAPASFFSDKEGVNKSLLLRSSKPMQVWIEYDERAMLVNVTLAPLSYPKPSKCLLSKHVNLSSVLLDSMYIGFSSATGIMSNSHYILGWSWNQSGKAQDLDPSKLPSLPRIGNQRLHFTRLFIVLLVVTLLLLLLIAGAAWAMRRNKYEELCEPWEQEFAPNRFSFRDLFLATKGFGNSELLGVGGFGKVYKGVLPSSYVQVAVKRVSHDSRQGMREFVAEIASMGRLRHRNLVHLLGYCRRKGELLLVYDYMPNGSLDKFLFGNHEKSKLSWSQRFRIIKGVGSALLYLHEEWEQVVLHRDVKASNVLLDAEMNARLGDFGLARLYDHGTDPRSTNVVGTMGYIAPEASRTRKITASVDVYAFGIFLLEAACGRRAICLQDGAEDIFLVDLVHSCWRRGEILEANDPRLEGNYVVEEMVTVLKLGLLCSHPKAEARPTMRQVIQFLDGGAILPEIPSDYDPEGNDFLTEGWGTLASFPSSFPSSSGNASLGPSVSDNSVLYCGR